MNYKLIKAKKYFKLGCKKIINLLRTQIYLKTGLFLPRPLKVYYLISNKCNYRCQICPQWQMGMSESTAEYISEEKMKEILNEMADLGINEFGISGGEPLLFKGKVMALLEYANRLGIYTHFVTNGSLLDEAFLDRYEKIGGGHVSLSIDAVGNKHDSLRGFTGAYGNVANVLSIFDNNNYKNILLKINLTLTNDNLKEAAEVAELAIQHKALIFIQPYDTYAYGQKDVLWKEENFPLWVKRDNYHLLDRTVKELINLKKIHPQEILNDIQHLAAIYKYFTDSNFTTRCLANFEQMAINPQGEVIFCKYGRMGDLKKQLLRQFLSSRQRREAAKSSLVCRDGCLLGCMFRPSFFEMAVNGSRQFLRIIGK